MLAIIKQRTADILTDAELALVVRVPAIEGPKTKPTVEKSPPVEAAKSTKDGKKRSRRSVRPPTENGRPRGSYAEFWKVARWLAAMRRRASAFWRDARRAHPASGSDKRKPDSDFFQNPPLSIS